LDHAQYSQLVSFIWGIADDVLRDGYVKGKYHGGPAAKYLAGAWWDLVLLRTL